MSFLQNKGSAFRHIILNKYVITLVVFFVFLIFFDDHNLINRWQTSRRIRGIEKEINFYQSEIDKNRKKMNEMQTSDKSLEKYAREQYYLKKDSEDVFIIREEE
ncbi:MAG TPA: septum formation initiator family protein [Paludibacteraceae bacterium]|nr:septum formation initiator family protein [Paludibacteraceae bacterium]HPT43548.1 septum formation initiator family protein [Paludibacteraceae bacterium]